MHKRRSHGDGTWSTNATKNRTTKAAPAAGASPAVLELTCETCSAPLPSIEKLKTHTIARHGREPRPSELVENRGPR